MLKSTLASAGLRWKCTLCLRAACCQMITNAQLHLAEACADVEERWENGFRHLLSVRRARTLRDFLPWCLGSCCSLGELMTHWELKRKKERGSFGHA